MANYLSKKCVYLDAGGHYWAQRYIEFAIGETYILNVRLGGNYLFAKCVREGGHKDYYSGAIYRAYVFEVIEGEVHHER